MQSSERKLHSVKKNKHKKIILASGVILFLFVLFLLQIWFSAKAHDLACETSKLAAKIKTLKDQNAILQCRIDQLGSAERISRIAEADFNMVRTSSVEVVFLGN